MDCLCIGDSGTGWLGMRCAQFPGQGPHTYTHPHKNPKADVHPCAISNQHGSANPNLSCNRYTPCHRYAHAGGQHSCTADHHA